MAKEESGGHMRRITSFLKDQRGDAIMLEASLVFTLTIFMLVFILALFSAVAQRAAILIITEESAAKAAQIYAYAKADAMSGEISQEDAVSVDCLRYILHPGGLVEAAKRRIEDYASFRLKKTTFAIIAGDPEVELAVVDDAMSRRHLEVSVSGRFISPFHGALEHFGFGALAEYVQTAQADCLDLIDYMNTVDFADDATSFDWLDSGAMETLNAALK
jgi:hypothetical protein